MSQQFHQWQLGNILAPNQAIVTPSEVALIAPTTSNYVAIHSQHNDVPRVVTLLPLDHEKDHHV